MIISGKELSARLKEEMAAQVATFPEKYGRVPHLVVILVGEGFFLPTSAQEKPQTCQVVAVGPGGIIDGKEIVMQVKVGDKVLCSNYAGSNFKVDGKEFTIIKQSDILAIVED